jgi:hypothetical protein
MDEVPKSSVHLFEALSDPETGNSGEANHTAFNRAFNVDRTMFDWLETTEQAYRLKRLGLGMRGVAALQPPDAILSGKWAPQVGG